VVWRAPSGRFAKRPKDIPQRPLLPEEAERFGGVYTQVVGRRVMHRDPVTGRFAKKPEAPEEVVIGKGKRAKVLRPRTDAAKAKPLRYDEADVMMQSASTVSRHIEDNARAKMPTYYKYKGAFHRVKPEGMGGFAQFIRLAAARYYAHMRPVMDSPWLQIGFVEFGDQDLFDLDSLSLAPDGRLDELAGTGAADVAAAAFLEDFEGLARNYLAKDGTKAGKDKPSAKGRGKAHRKDTKARRGRRD